MSAPFSPEAGAPRLGMAERPILYSFRRCPYAMRARMALAISGTISIIREVALSDKPDALAAVSPKATVPVLVLQDGRVLDESLDIMRWALGRRDPEGWLDRADEAGALITENDGAFKYHLDRYKYHDRYAADPLEHRHAALGMLERLDARLGLHANLCSEGRSFADMAIMPFVRQFAQTDRTWFDAQKLPNLQLWLARHVGSSLFEQAMVKLEPWRPQTPDILFPLPSSD